MTTSQITNILSDLNKRFSAAIPQGLELCLHVWDRLCPLFRKLHEEYQHKASFQNGLEVEPCKEPWGEKSEQPACKRKRERERATNKKLATSRLTERERERDKDLCRFFGKGTRRSTFQ